MSSLIRPLPSVIVVVNVVVDQWTWNRSTPAPRKKCTSKLRGILTKFWVSSTEKSVQRRSIKCMTIIKKLKQLDWTENQNLNLQRDWISKLNKYVKHIREKKWERKCFSSPKKRRLNSRNSTFPEVLLLFSMRILGFVNWPLVFSNCFDKNYINPNITTIETPLFVHPNSKWIKW